MSSPKLIGQPDRITPGWITEVLAQAGVNAKVTGFTASSIGTGQVGENVRFKLTGTGDLPASIVGKFASADPVSRQTGIDTANYLREVHFYRHLQSKVAIQTPQVYFADSNAGTHEFVIMMEDLAPGEQGDQLGGCGGEQAALALVQLAELHGPAWDDRSMIDGQLISDRRLGAEGTRDLYNFVSAGFLARYSDRLDDDERQMVTLVGENLSAYMQSYTGSQTLIHIDYRLDNMMFGGPYPLAVVDWQSPAFDCALLDVSYFLGTSVPVEERAAIEQQLVRRYYEALSAYPVSLSWDECWHYYRHYAPAGLIMAVIASMIVGETDRGNDMFMAMAKRSACMSRELDAISAIRGQ